MLEGEEFFKRFNSGFTFNEWMNEMENPQWREKIQRYYDKIYQIIIEEYQQSFLKMVFDVNVLVVLEDACWDCQFYVPVLKRLTENKPHIKVKLLQKQGNIDIMEKTNGGLKSPYVLFYSEDGYFIDKWVERPTKVYDLIANIRKKIGFDKDISKDFYRQYRKEFLKNQEEMYRCAIEEFTDKICRSHSIQGTSPRINGKRSELTSKMLLEAEI